MANDEETAVEDEHSREAVWIIIRAGKALYYEKNFDFVETGIKTDNQITAGNVVRSGAAFCCFGSNRLWRVKASVSGFTDAADNDCGY